MTSIQPPLLLVDSLFEMLDSAPNTAILSYGLNHNKQVVSLREKAVHWLTSISYKYSLRRETLFKAVQLLDIYISKTRFKIVKVEQVTESAVACLNLACKTEETNSSFLAFFHLKLLHNHQVTNAQMVQTELHILKVLNFRLNIPHFYDFNSTLLNLVTDTLDPLDIKLRHRLADINCVVVERYLLLKESIFSPAVNSGLVCLQTSIIALQTLSDKVKLNRSCNKVLVPLFGETFVTASQEAAHVLFEKYFLQLFEKSASKEWTVGILVKQTRLD